jgi:hypothetical protein
MGVQWAYSAPAVWNKINFSCTIPISLCKLVGTKLRPIWWLILMSISCISVHALFNSPVHDHSFRVSSPILQ